MTLALATGDEEAIYLATESYGLPAAGPAPPHLVLNSKLLDLQIGPEVAVLVAGGLDHWCHVAGRYLKQPTIHHAVRELQRLLDGCMRPQDQASGLVCGFEGRQPRCFRVDRFQGDQRSAVREEELYSVQPLGTPAHASIARDNARMRIGNHENRLMALVSAIEERLPGHLVRRPIHVRVLRPGS